MFTSNSGGVDEDYNVYERLYIRKSSQIHYVYFNGFNDIKLTFFSSYTEPKLTDGRTPQWILINNSCGMVMHSC